MTAQDRAILARNSLRNWIREHPMLEPPTLALLREVDELLADLARRNDGNHDR